MNIKIIAVGKIKKGYVYEGVCDFSRRLSKYVNASLVEVKDEPADNTFAAAEDAARKKEGRRILGHIGEKSYVICLDMKGNRLCSEMFAALIAGLKMERIKEAAFVIGGSTGLDEAVLSRADYRLSLGDMTFPHELARLFLLEQLYRAEKILHGEPYHK